MSWLKYFKRFGSYEKPRYAKFQDTTLFLTLALWLCTLPLLALLALPFLGWKLAAYLAGGLLVVDLFICWFVCTFRLVRKPVTEKLEERKLGDDKYR